MLADKSGALSMTQIISEFGHGRYFLISSQRTRARRPKDDSVLLVSASY